MRRLAAWIALFVLCGAVDIAWADRDAPAGAKRPWWLEFTPVVSVHGEPKSFTAAAGGVARGVGYPSGWYGYWFYDDQQRIGVGARSEKWAAANGLRKMIYYDSGEVGDYAAFFDNAGKLIYNGWSLPWWKNEPVTARWFGLAAFMNDVAWAPYPTAKQYGLSQFVDPQGEPVANIYDVIARRNIAGEWKYDFSSNPRITDDVAQRAGLVPHPESLCR